jgi:predicted tellurium resistance membrane protein TerC
MSWLSADLLTTENLLALLTLTGLEIVLGIDNIVFLAIVTGKLPKAQQPKARRIGLAVAMGMRIVLLLGIAWVSRLTEPFVTVLGRAFSGRDLILLGGGLFLIAKATFEIHGTVESGGGAHGDEAGSGAKSATFASAILQILMLDMIFSLDSVITAVGMASEIAIMITAVVVSVGVMMVFATPVSDFVVRHPTVKMLALAFLLLIGTVLVADGWGKHIDKGYIYFAMGFSIAVEMLNFRLRRKAAVTTP